MCVCVCVCVCCTSEVAPVYDILPLCCRKKSKKRKSGDVQPVFGVDSKDMRHGKFTHGINQTIVAETSQKFMTMTMSCILTRIIWSWENF